MNKLQMLFKKEKIGEMYPGKKAYNNLLEHGYLNVEKLVEDGYLFA